MFVFFSAIVGFLAAFLISIRLLEMSKSHTELFAFLDEDSGGFLIIFFIPFTGLAAGICLPGFILEDTTLDDRVAALPPGIYRDGETLNISAPWEEVEIVYVGRGGYPVLRAKKTGETRDFNLTWDGIPVRKIEFRGRVWHLKE